MCRLHKIRAAERLSHVRSRGFSDHQGGAGLGGGGGGQGLLQGMRRQGNLEVDARVSVVAIEGCIERLFFSCTYTCTIFSVLTLMPPFPLFRGTVAYVHYVRRMKLKPVKPYKQQSMA
jgi:hypothetical protein